MKSKVVLNVGTSCHVSCKFCYKEFDKNKANYYKSIEEIRKEIYGISLVSNSILLSGGETLNYPFLKELLSETDKYNLSVCIVTIGDRLSDIDFLFDLLKHKSLTSFQLSIHTLNRVEANELYGNNFILEKQLNGLKNVVNSGVNFGFNIVMNRYNIKSIGETILGLNKLGGKIFYISGLHFYDGITKENIKSTIPYLGIIKELEKIKDIINNGKIKLALKSFPLCIHKKIAGIKYQIRELSDRDRFKSNSTGKSSMETKSKLKTKIDKCNNCYAYGKDCFGPYEYYMKIFGDKEFEALSKEDYFLLEKENPGDVWEK